MLLRPHCKADVYVKLSPYITGPRERMARPQSMLDCDSVSLQDSTGPYTRTTERGPLIIPDHVMTNQQRTPSPRSLGRRGSAESLVEKVNTTLTSLD